MIFREEDEESDVASFREPGHSHKEARLAALLAKTKQCHQDLAYESWQASVRHEEASVTQEEKVKCEGPRNAHLAELQEVLMSADVERILKDIGELPKFRFPNNIKRSGHVARDDWGADCSEVYSPPRVTKLAGEVGLQAGCALDLTTLDDEGNP